ncbi:unnamed protein product, partial [marine sediment metagenome]
MCVTGVTGVTGHRVELAHVKTNAAFDADILIYHVDLFAFARNSV